jgi:hypothetical protein
MKKMNNNRQSDKILDYSASLKSNPFEDVDI